MYPAKFRAVYCPFCLLPTPSFYVFFWAEMGEVWEQSHGAKLCICNKYMEVGVDEIGVDYGTLMIKLLLLLISRSMSCLSACSAKVCMVYVS